MIAVEACVYYGCPRPVQPPLSVAFGAIELYNRRQSNNEGETMDEYLLSS